MYFSSLTVDLFQTSLFFINRNRSGLSNIYDEINFEFNTWFGIHYSV